MKAEGKYNSTPFCEEAIREIKDHYESIIEQLPGHIYWKDKNGIILGCNNLQAQAVGLETAQDMVGLTAYDTLPSDQADEITRVDQQVVSSGQAIITEEISNIAGGKKRAYLSKKVPLIRKRTNEIVGVLGVSIDITDFKRTKKKLQEVQHKLEAMTAVSFSLAHELRMPLTTIEFNASGLSQFLPLLLESYKMAQEAKIPVPEIPQIKLKLLENVLAKIKLEVKAAFNFIEMLLMKTNPSVSAKSVEVFSMANCIKQALERYPFLGKQKKLINIDLSEDFSVQADSLLLIHVFYNLLKNAIYYIEAAGKGSISIQLKITEHYNKVHFNDTGKGISADMLPHIFKRFFSKTYHGAGVGLTFCKIVMQSLGGKIVCESIEGQYTRFTLFFPKVVP